MTTLVRPVHSFTYDGTRINVYHANKGEGLPRHQHIFAHGTFCTTGAMVVRKEGREVAIDKHTQPINLVAHEWHELEATEDNTVFCNVFADQYSSLPVDYTP